MKNVVIVKARVEGFRVPFYEALGDTLAGRGVALSVIHGQPYRDGEGEPDPPPFRYGVRVRSRYINLGASQLVWQPVLDRLRGADLVVVQQGNKQLLNHVLLVSRKWRGYRLAFWGHGKNFQAANASSLAERFKRRCSRMADHWFAYTDKAKGVLISDGVPEPRITVVNNAVDTHTRQAAYSGIQEGEVRLLRQRLGIGNDAPVGIYCGRMYDIKKIPLLLSSLEIIRQQLPSFHFLALGDGPDSAIVKSFAAAHARWFHYVGRATGEKLALHFRASDLQLMPGAVGLAVVDSFAMLTPLVTTASALHGPEICYLEHGINGLVLPDNPAAYAQGVVDVFRDPGALQQLSAGCARAREVYTIDEMLRRFAGGVDRALGRSPMPA